MANKQIHELGVASALANDDLILVSTSSGNFARNALISELPYEAQTGMATRRLSDKLDEWVSVLDFGALGDGIADDAPAIQAALDASRAVHFPAGKFRLSAPLHVKPGRRITGSGRDATIVQALGNQAFIFHRNEGAYEIDASSASDWNRSSISAMTINMAVGGIRAIGHEFRAFDLCFFDGNALDQASANGWCIDMVDANEGYISGINAGYGGGLQHDMKANGIRWRAQTVGVNYGDSLVEDISIKLSNAGTVGILLDGHTSSAQENVCNNMVLQRIQVNAPTGGSGITSLAGSTGIKLWNAARICLIDCNIEVAEIGFDEYSERTGASAGACVANTYINCITHNCPLRYRDSNESFGRSVVQRNFIGCDNLAPIQTGNVSGDNARAQDGDAFLQGAWIFDNNGEPSVQFRSRTKDVLLITGDHKGADQPDADGHPSQPAPYHGFLLDLSSTEAARITRPVANGSSDPEDDSKSLSDVRLELGNGEGDARGELARVQINDPLRLPARLTEPQRPIDGMIYHAGDAAAMPPTGDWYLGPGIYARVNSGDYPPVAVERGAVPEREKNGNFSVSAADFGKILRVNHGNDRVVTIPAGLVPAGSGARRFWVIRQGTGRVTFNPAGVNIRSTGNELDIARQFQMVEVILRNNNDVYISHILPDALQRFERPLHWTAGNVTIPSSYLGKLVRVSNGGTDPVFVKVPTGIVPVGMDAASLWVMKTGNADVDIQADTGMSLAAPGGGPYQLTEQNKIVELVISASTGNQPNTVYVID